MLAAVCKPQDVSHSVAAFILFAPLAGFVFLLFFGKRLPGRKAGIVGTAMAALSFLHVVLTFLAFRHRCGEDARFVLVKLFDWIHVGNFRVDVLLRLDALSLTMALFVTGIGTLIHLYSIGYMSHDPRFSRFFVYLNLFLASMLLLVLGGNFLMTFVGWEGVGTCSYLLISFWFERDSAASAGKKAFVTNRIGDFGFLLAMFLIVSKLSSHGITHALDYNVFLTHTSLLKGSTTAICLLLLLGACGKSAQIPLHVWLPDAMEGPTPVSALIHAATMVTAGVYLMVRVSPLLEMSPTARNVIVIIGAATAFFAATVAIAQDDIKRVLAYSTLSQLGYMFIAVGCGAYVAAIFHMVTHAFFKALLFLGSGSVIHGLHEEQDMKHMGGLRKLMPITATTFLIGWLAIAGVPPFAGFWSKDDILHAAYDKSPILWGVGLITALMTAYYMTRQVVLVWLGDRRFKENLEEDKKLLADTHGEEASEPDHDHGKRGVHESPWVMTVPLGVLAFLSIVGGAINLPFGPKHILENFFGSLVPELGKSSTSAVTLGIFATGAALIGMLAAYLIWRRNVNHPKLEPTLLKRAWFVDPLYQLIIQKPGQALANFSAFVFDKKVIDGAVNGSGYLVQATGTQVRKWQSGYVRTYALTFALAVVAIIGFGLFRAWS